MRPPEGDRSEGNILKNVVLEKYDFGIFDMRDFPMMPIPSGAGRDIVTYRLAKRGNGVVLEQEHIHSTKPISMWFRRAMIDIEINGKPATKEMLEKAVKFMHDRQKDKDGHMGFTKV